MQEAAEKKFKEVAQAYEILSDPNKRQLYDRFGEAGIRNGGAGPSGMPTHMDPNELFAQMFGQMAGGMAGFPAGGVHFGAMPGGMAFGGSVDLNELLSGLMGAAAQGRGPMGGAGFGRPRAAPSAREHPATVRDSLFGWLRTMAIVRSYIAHDILLEDVSKLTLVSSFPQVLAMAIFFTNPSLFFVLAMLVSFVQRAR